MLPNACKFALHKAKGGFPDIRATGEGNESSVGHAIGITVAGPECTPDSDEFVKGRPTLLGLTAGKIKDTWMRWRVDIRHPLLYI